MIKDILDKYEREPFIWGINDCCVFAANIQKELIGIDYAEKFRGTYSTEEEAWKLAGNDLVEFISNIINMEPSTNFNECKSGYPVAYKYGNKYSLGICYGERAYFITHLHKYLKIPLNKCEYYWKLG